MHYSYDERIKACIRATLRNNPCTFEEIVRGCYGVYPLTVNELLQDMCVHSRFTQLYCMQENEVPHSAGFEVDQRQVELVTYSVENNPILSNWYFSWHSCKKLASFDIWKEKRILFLGTPRLFEYFVLHEKGLHLTLIDLDKYVTGLLKSKYCIAENASYIDIQNVDINLLEETGEKYDAVFLDPPWYFETYFQWLSKAVIFTAPKGQIFMSVFPFLTRPTASDERKKIFKYCRQVADSVLTIPAYLDYDIPTFEKSELSHANIDMRSNWKIADLLILQNPIFKFGPEAMLAQTYANSGQEYQKWTEFSLFGLRWFVCEPSGPDDENTLSLISLVEKSPYLTSPSYRNPQLRQANLQSSRGHGLHVNNVQRFMSTIEELKHKCDILPLERAIAELEIDLESKELLQKIGGSRDG